MNKLISLIHYFGLHGILVFGETTVKLVGGVDKGISLHPSEDDGKIAVIFNHHAEVQYGGKTVEIKTASIWHEGTTVFVQPDIDFVPHWFEPVFKIDLSKLSL